jgi:hypothetical protein
MSQPARWHLVAGPMGVVLMSKRELNRIEVLVRLD